MKKKLIFHFYVVNDWITHPIVSLHLKLLRHYADFFDEAMFVIALNDINDTTTINEIETMLVDIGYHNVEFKVVKNDAILRESMTFYEFFVKQLGKYDGILYFGHIKGVFDISSLNKKYENISHWVCLLYYQTFSKEYYNEISSNSRSIACGANKDITLRDDYKKRLYNGKYDYCYGGTFLGINCPKLIEWAKKTNTVIDVPFHGTNYSENYISNVIPPELAFGKWCKHGKNRLDNYDYLEATFDALNKSEINKFKDFYKKIHEEKEISVSFLCD